MNLIDFADSSISLFPPLTALVLAILTRKVLLSLGVGIVLGALLLNDYAVGETISYTASKLFAVFVADGSINSWNMSLVAFLLLLGMMTALLSASGSTQVFATWAQTHIKSKRGSLIFTSTLGIFIFIDDYFNSLTVGAVARPVTDQYKVSRAKLAYILDSTAAPMCVIAPASSWGAYIITIIAGILATHEIVEYSAITAYIMLIPMNFYAIFAILMVLVVSWFNLDFGKMRHSEAKAAHVIKQNTQTNTQQQELNKAYLANAKVSYLVVPILILIVATISIMILTGAQVLAQKEQVFSIIGAFENTDVGTSLVYGSLLGFLATLIAVGMQKMPITEIGKDILVGAHSMVGAILILIFAWVIGGVIGDLKTGSFLANLASNSIGIQWLPVLLFVISGVMSFATGTSWGTFGIMLPIAGGMVSGVDTSILFPMLSAVLAGAVFGDHCSPISDTSILSSTGAQCDHMEHVLTQLPYAILVAFISIIGFIVIGFTSSVWLSLMASFAAFIIICGLMMFLDQKSHGMQN